MQEHSDADDNRKECPKCFRIFMTDDSLTVHIESAHPDFDYNGYLVKVSKDKERGLDKKNRFEDEKLFKEDGWRCKKMSKIIQLKRSLRISHAKARWKSQMSQVQRRI